MRYVTKGMLCKGTGYVSSSITHRCTLEKYCLHGLREDIYQSNDKRNVKGLMINGVHGQAQHKAYLWGDIGGSMRGALVEWILWSHVRFKQERGKSQRLFKIYMGEIMTKVRGGAADAGAALVQETVEWKFLLLLCVDDIRKCVLQGLVTLFGDMHIFQFKYRIVWLFITANWSNRRGEFSLSESATLIAELGIALTL